MSPDDAAQTTDARSAEHDWYSNETATFGDRLSDARQAVGMAQDDLARRLGVKLSTLTKWENDQSEPRAARLNVLSGMLNVSLRWLLTGEGEGLAQPADGELPADLSGILTEMRQLQVDMIRNADRLGRMEKRMRLAMAGGE